MDRYVDLRFVRERLKGLYRSTGRPSIDPEVLLRLLLVGYPYGITSERRVLEEVRMHLAPIAGSHGWVLSRKFQTIRRFPKIGTDVFGSLMCFGRCSRKSCDGVWRQAWLKVRIWRWMGPWWEPMQADRVESRESS